MSSQALRDVAPLPTGRFRLDVLRRGRLVDAMDERNMVVIGAGAILANLIAGVPGFGLTRLGLGSSMLPANFGNTNLTDPFTKAFDSIARPTPSSATFNFTIGATEANGLNIGEFGLLTDSGLLFARKARATSRIPKDATMALVGSWTIDWGSNA